MNGLVRLNNHMFTRASVTVRYNGLIRIDGVDSMEWSDEVSQELVGGMNNGGPPLGKARGPYTCAASMSLYEDEAAAFIKVVALTDPTVLGDLAKVNFQMGVTVTEDIRSSTTLLANVTIKGRSNSVSNDGAALVKAFTLQPTVIVQDGLSLVSLVPKL